MSTHGYTENDKTWTGDAVSDYVWTKAYEKQGADTIADYETVRRLHDKIVKKVRLEALQCSSNGMTGRQKRYVFDTASVISVVHKYLSTWDGNEACRYVLDALRNEISDPVILSTVYRKAAGTLKKSAVADNHYTHSGKRYRYDPDTVMRITDDILAECRRKNQKEHS